MKPGTMTYSSVTRQSIVPRHGIDANEEHNDTIDQRTLKHARSGRTNEAAQAFPPTAGT